MHSVLVVRQDTMGIYNGLVICVFYITAVAGLLKIENEMTSNVLHESQSVINNSEADRNLVTSGENVTIDLYYESLCPYCIEFFEEGLMPVLKKIGQHVIVNPYPYGNAETIEKNGVISFECQHGQDECYGNKLHACALDILGKGPVGIKFIACLIRTPQNPRNLRRLQSGSNDAAAGKCGKAMSVDVKPIKKCAKGRKSTELLKYYGEETKKANIHGVPTIVINGKESEDDDFFADVCAAFKHPPPECKTKINLVEKNH